MGITVEKAEEILKRNGITREDLPKALKENALNIGMFTMPFQKMEEIEK
ncbi:hypothetical protein JW813_09135 [Clostridium botulinum]|nr:hypothetical protein [Clostridium botulinum]UZP01902.1 hypothetical protein JW813_09135 [Clostridium botulinum]UZP05260.1 hypothetical protein JYA71_09405 [Clostridium botulinum]UZP08641.1 hypothetical protein JYA74_09130 [Clostridium botulinum]